MSMDRLVSLIAVFMALVLAWRGLRAHRVGRQRAWMMAAGWAAIFVALALLFRMFVPGTLE